VSTDPAGFAAGDANLYRFAGNDPVNFADPSGLSQAGHPLAGGYSGNKTRQSAIPRGTLAAPQLGTTSIIGQTGPYAPGLNLNITVPQLRPTSTFGGVTVQEVSSLALAGPRLSPSRAMAVPPGPTARRNAGRQYGPRTQVPSGQPNLVRAITPNAPILPRPAADLPGVAPALARPRDFVIGNHSDLGYTVLDIHDGSVRYVTGDDYLPIRTHARRAYLQGQDDAARATRWDLAGEVLISVSPIHETTRDFRIAGEGYDFTILLIGSTP
jgi:hypothetical protein